MITLGTTLDEIGKGYRQGMSKAALDSLIARYRVAFMEAEPWQIRHELTMLAANIRRDNPAYRTALLQFAASKF